MNITKNNNSEYYNDLIIEIAILQEDIILPEINDSSLNIMDFINARYKNTIGKFYLPSIMPLIDPLDGAKDIQYAAPKTTKSNGTIKPNKYTEKNYIELIIPKYIMMQFDNKIKKGTKFVVGYSGVYKKISNMNIIGLYGAELEV